MADNEKSDLDDFREPGLPVFEPAATPRERLKQVFQKNPLGLRSFELRAAEVSAGTSFLVGLAIGGTMKGPAAQQTWKKTHAHSVFYDNKDAARYMMNYLVRRFLYDGCRYGFRVGAVSGIMVLSAGCLAAYRDRAKVTDIGIGGTIAAALYRIDVGPRAMLASGIIGGIFWQLVGVAIWSIGRWNGYAFNDFYKEMRKQYYEIMNARTRYRRELREISAETDAILWPSQVRDIWAQRKLGEEQRLAILRENSKGEVNTSPAVTPKSDQSSGDNKKSWWKFW